MDTKIPRAGGTGASAFTASDTKPLTGNTPETQPDGAFAYRQTFRLDPRFSVEFVLDGERFECRWQPYVPKGHEARALLDAYRRARDEFFSSLGVNVLVVDL
jgi:hypothetical protein